MLATKRSRGSEGGAGGAPGKIPRSDQMARGKQVLNLNEKLLAFFVFDGEEVGLGLKTGVGARNETNSSYNSRICAGRESAITSFFTGSIAMCGDYFFRDNDRPPVAFSMLVKNKPTACWCTSAAIPPSR